MVIWKKWAPGASGGFLIKIWHRNAGISLINAAPSLLGLVEVWSHLQWGTSTIQNHPRKPTFWEDPILTQGFRWSLRLPGFGPLWSHVSHWTWQWQDVFNSTHYFWHQKSGSWCSSRALGGFLNGASPSYHPFRTMDMSRSQKPIYFGVPWRAVVPARLCYPATIVRHQYP